MFTANKTVAVIDDNEMILEALDRLLSALGYQTELYGSGEAFIDAVMSSKAACLIVNVQLGGISGVDLGGHLSAMGFTFPVIFMTGSTNALFREQAMELGCIAYLQKPFEAGELQAAITNAIG